MLDRSIPSLKTVVGPRVEALAGAFGVAQIFNLLFRRFAIGRRPQRFRRSFREQHPAEFNSAIQQIANLRYDFAMPAAASSSGRATAPAASATSRIHNPAFLFSLALLALVVWAFLPIVDNDFVSYDDPDYVTSQVMVQRGLTWDAVKWAFTTTDASNWHPLTWLSHALDCQLFQASAAGHHLTSLLLHAVNTLLVFLLLRSLTGASWRSFFVAAFFGLHPLRVESVAWVAERKDVLSTFFWLLTMIAYVGYARNSGSPKSKVQGLKSSRAYGLSLLFFALGLMSKPMLVTLPFALLLLDYWPLQRFNASTLQRSNASLFLEKIPFFALAFAACLVTFLAQHQGGAVDANIPFDRRSANAVISLIRYLGKLLRPTNLAVFYPYPPHWPVWLAALALVVVVGITWLALNLRRRAPYFITGWLWYLGTLVPVLGIVQVGQQAMADRYTYIPTLGVLIALVWGGHQLIERRPDLMRIVALAVGGAVVACGFLTRHQTGYWKNTEVLARHALDATGENFPAYNLLGTALLRQNKVDEAVEQFRHALNLQPNSADAHSNLAVALQREGRRDDAIEHYQLALQYRPRYPQAHFNYATALEEAGRLSEALDQYSQALSERPNFVDAGFNRGSVLLRLERYDEAIAQFHQVLQLEPNSPDALNNLGVAYDRKGRLADALQCYRKVAELKPDDPKAFFNLGVALQRKGLIPDAIRCFEEAIRLKPDYADARTNLDAILALKARSTTTRTPEERR